jgi:hypothetical protein
MIETVLKTALKQHEGVIIYFLLRRVKGVLNLPEDNQLLYMIPVGKK